MKGYYVYELGTPKVLVAIIGPFPYGGPDNAFFNSNTHVVTNGRIDGATNTVSGWQMGPSNPDTATDGSGLPAAREPGQDQLVVAVAALAGATSILLSDDGSGLRKSLQAVIISSDNTSVVHGGVQTVTYVAKSVSVPSSARVTVQLDKPLTRNVSAGELVNVVRNVFR